MLTIDRENNTTVWKKSIHMFKRVEQISIISADYKHITRIRYLLKKIILWGNKVFNANPPNKILQNFKIYHIVIVIIIDLIINLELNAKIIDSQER